MLASPRKPSVAILLLLPQLLYSTESLPEWFVDMGSFQHLCFFWNAGHPNLSLAPLVFTHTWETEESQRPAINLCRPACEITQSSAQPWGKHWTLAGQAYTKPSSSLGGLLASVPLTPPNTIFITWPFISLQIKFLYKFPAFQIAATPTSFPFWPQQTLSHPSSTQPEHCHEHPLLSGGHGSAVTTSAPFPSAAFSATCSRSPFPSSVLKAPRTPYSLTRYNFLPSASPSP